MSGDEAVDPAEVPVFTGDLDRLDTKVKALSIGSAKIATATGDVHTSFGGLRAFYKAPEAEQLFAVTKPVSDKGLSMSSDLCVIAGALGAYARDARPLKEKLEQLKAEVSAFRAKIADDDKWREDGDLTDENLERRNEIAEAWAAFQEIERTCHDKIVALVCGTRLRVNDGSNQEGMYGYDAEALKQSESLPWGEAVEESTPGWQVWEHAWDFGKGVIVDGVWGTVRGLGTLVGVDGWDAAGQAWVGLGQLATGVVISAVPGANLAFWSADDKDMPAWLRDSRKALKETGKALVAWDKWGENPSRAAGAVTFNVVTTIFAGGAGGAAAGAGKAGTTAKALSFVGKAGRAIDPTTYLFKGVGMSLSKIGDALAALRGMGKVEVSALPEGAIMLPEGSFKLADGTLHLPEGAPIPEGAFEVPKGTFQLPEGVPIPKGAVDLGHGMVKMPDGTPPPAGSTPVAEGTVKVPEGATALPEGTTVVKDLEGKTFHLDRQGNLFKEDGTLHQHHSAAPRENPPQTAPNPAARVPVTAGAVAARVGDDAAGAARLGDSLADDLGDVGRAGDDAPAGRAGDNAPGGVANNMPTGQAGDNLDGPAGSAGRTGDTPAATGSTRPGANLGDDAVPGPRPEPPGAGAGRNLPTGALDEAIRTRPEAPGGGGVDEAARAGDDANTPPGDGTVPPQRQPVPRPSFMRDTGNPYGPRGSLTLEQIEEIQVYRANEEPGYRERHYRKDGTRQRLERYDESGYTPPQLTRLSEDGPWIRAKDAPEPPKPHFLDDDYISVGADTVTSKVRRRILEEAARIRHLSVKWDNLMADWKAETGRAHAAQGTIESAALWGEAKGAYKESHTRMGDDAEAFGEAAAEHHFIAERYPDFESQSLLGPKNGNDQFDQVWKHEDGRVVVVEAKSSADTELGRRTLRNGRQVSQGSREYFFDIIRVMERRGEFKVAADLRNALKEGKLEYVVVKGEKNSGTYTGYQYRRFDISKGTLP
ncbi:hypothetical protein AB0M39_10390 [Streptomyces sp. NPDC051907]|uniref:hypothetical protein n=1 Tax=Streptomyces sp. NPDC051907 TaxID=3155284 RepID=UPI00342B59BB